MTIDECYNLGKILKPWGVKGQMTIYLDVDEPDDYRELDSAYVDIKGSLVPHFFCIDQLNGNRAVVTFEGLSAEQAASLAGRELYLPLSMLPKLEGNKFYYHEVRGFRVVDSEHGYIGDLKQVIEYPAQPLFQVMNGQTEILIPAIDQVIERLDRDEKTLYVTAPPGLIDLYLQG